MAKSRKKAPRRDRRGNRTTTIKAVLKAKSQFQADDFPKAIRSSIAAINAEDREMNVVEAVLISDILKDCGETETSADLVRKTRARVLDVVGQNPDSGEANRNAGYLLLETGEEEASEPYLKRALELDPSDRQTAYMLLNRILKKGAPDEIIELWQPHIAASESQGAGFLTLAKALGHFGFQDHALRMLARATAYFDPDNASFAHAAAGIRGEELSPRQHAQSIEMFDKFADFYDENLALLQNNGPRIVGEMLDRLPIEREGKLDILDAGCGTGLCVPYLRPFARHLHGFDFSIGMLEASKAKGSYDLLTRSDLSVAATLPEGTFDLIVCADVFVYFGDLTVGLRNLAAKLRPGGWLIFTTEDAGNRDVPRGFRLGASGRYFHSEEHILKSLTASGFKPPSHQFLDTLRFEFGLPVEGRAVATQKLALVPGLGG